MLKEKTSNKFGEFAIVRHLEYLLELTGIGFLKEVMARDGTKILQISIGKYKDVMAHVQELKNRQKEDGANVNVWVVRNDDLFMFFMSKDICFEKNLMVIRDLAINN